MHEPDEGEVWADILNRKHECFPIGAHPIEVTHEGRRLEILMPDVLVEPERLEVKTVFGSGELLVIIGRHTMTGHSDPYERGILMVARRRDAGTFAVHVWHEMYPWALEYLGLEGPEIA